MNTPATESTSDLGHVAERLRELQGEAEALLSTLDRTSGEIEHELRDQLSKRPYAVLAAAAGVGYVLGGGLPSPLTRLLMILGGRVGFELVSRELGNRVSERFSTPQPERKAS